MSFKFNIPSLQNKVLPPLPPFPVSHPEAIASADFGELPTVDESAIDQVEYTVFSTPQTVPVKMKLKSDSEWWLLPVEPLMTIGGKSILAKRNVSKSAGRGSIKERWAQDDYIISINALITTPDSEQYPVEDLRKLKRICEAKEPIDILSPPLVELGIVRVVIEEFEYPFTKGAENQAYSLKCLSDDDWDLFIKIDNPQ